jgi:hypothetical protein
MHVLVRKFFGRLNGLSARSPQALRKFGEAVCGASKVAAHPPAKLSTWPSGLPLQSLPV